MNQIIKIGSAPIDQIELLLENDPRLISKHTTRQYKSNLIDFEYWRHGRAITKTLVESYAAHLQKMELAPKTINQRLASIRWYARKMADIALDEFQDREMAEQAARVALVQDVKGDSPQAGRHLAQGELSALIATCKADKNKTAGARDIALFAVAWMTGARREELAGMQLQDLTRTDDGIEINILGKGQKIRTGYADGGALNYLMDWLDIRGTEPGAVFCKVNKAGKLHPQRAGMTGKCLSELLHKRTLQAGIPQVTNWHDFRRTFIGNLWEEGIDGSTIQDLAGHASQNQTKQYDRRPKDRLRRAVKVLHVPYSK